MGPTIKEVLENAPNALKENSDVQSSKQVASLNLKKARALLDAGYKAEDDFNQSWKEYVDFPF